LCIEIGRELEGSLGSLLEGKVFLNGVKGSGCDPIVDCPLCSPEVLRRTIINVRIGGALF